MYLSIILCDHYKIVSIIIQFASSALSFLFVTHLYDVDDMHAILSCWFVCMHCCICTAHCCTFFVLRLTLSSHYFLKNLSTYMYGYYQFRSINFMLNILRIHTRVITFRRKYSNWQSDYIVLAENVSIKQINTNIQQTNGFCSYHRIFIYEDQRRLCHCQLVI